MAFDVSAVEAKYTNLCVRGFPVEDFVDELAGGPLQMAGEIQHGDWWGNSWEGKALYEFTRSGLMELVASWGTVKKLSPNDQRSLQSWLTNLPYNNDSIMLRFSW